MNSVVNLLFAQKLNFNKNAFQFLKVLCLNQYFEAGLCKRTNSNGLQNRPLRTKHVPKGP